LSYKRFQEIISDTYPDCGVSVYGDILPQIKELIVKSMYAVRKKIDPYKRKHTFEMFGYDFILDEDFNVWLIEVNTNPCIEESSELLKVLLPRMIEDMLRITIDRIFPRIYKKGYKNQKRSNNTTLTSISSPQKSVKKGAPLDKIPEEAGGKGEEIRQPATPEAAKKPRDPMSRIHPVPGYPDSENMWERVWNLEKPDTLTTKYPNHRSEFLFSVNENRQFKVKRNPLYKKVLKEMHK